MGQKIGQGGFFFPEVYEHSKDKVVASLMRGEMDLATVSRWHLADEFFAYILQSKFLEHADKTYPNPRRKNEIPVWFQISCQLLLHSLGQVSYKALDALLYSGPILNRMGFNVLAPLGFNDKNTYPRKTPVHQDAVRKFFKDTDAQEMRTWFSTSLQSWFRSHGMYDNRGIFIIDQTHIVVPANENYEDAVWMPVDEFGHLYDNYDILSEEQKKALQFHPCYTLSTLLHINDTKDAAHFAGYEWGPGNQDELPQAMKLIDTFFRHNEPGSIKLLIVDRGYISGDFIKYVKGAYGVDVLIPLKKSMDQYQDALAIAYKGDVQWVQIQAEGMDSKDVTHSVRACTIDKICQWDACRIPLYTTVVEDKHFDYDEHKLVTNCYVLVCTKKFDSPNQVISHYSMRVKTEDCFKQLKIAWNLTSFPSPHRSLIEAHIGFTLITFCLFQLFLSKEQNSRRLKQMLTTLMRDHVTLKDALLVYANGYFGIFSSKEYFKLITQLPKEAQNKIAAQLDSLPNQF